MAFTYKEVRKIVRFKERDNDEVTFSDYEIKESVNEAIRYLSNQLADSNADFNEKERFYDHKEHKCDFLKDGMPLPEDFLSLVAVKGKPHIEEIMTPCLSSETPRHWEYKVMGNRIYVGAPHFCLVYKAAIPEVEEDDDEIEIPNFAKDSFITLVRRILTNADGELMSEAQEAAVDALIPKRRYRGAKIRMPFVVGNYRRRW